MFVIQRDDDAFVQDIHKSDDSVYVSSYTRYLQKARAFLTREAAEREGVCSNERIVSVEEILAPR